MNKEKFKKLLLMNFAPITKEEQIDTPEAQLIDGQWYAPLWGCDTIQQILDEFEEANNEK